MSDAVDILGWDSTIWYAMNNAVHDETQKTKAAQQILSINGPFGDITTVTSDIALKDQNGNGFRISEDDLKSLIETSVKFVITKTSEDPLPD
jgi:hypothetical protein